MRHAIQPRRVEPFKISQELEKSLKTITGKLMLGTEEDPQEPGPCGFIPNMFDLARNLAYGGIGLSEEDTYLAFKSLVKLTVTKGAKQMRLWGKILCSGKDYYIAEGVAEGGEEQELPPDV